MKTLLLISLISLSALCERLEFVSLLENSTPLEISGIAKYKGQFIIVSDNLEDTYFYGLKMGTKTFTHEKTIDISALQGYYPYRLKSYFDFHYPKLFKQQWDLEGIAVCGEDIYFVNEQHRHVLKKSGNTLIKLDIDFNEIYKKEKTPLNKYELNAGFEGIAVDCKNKRIFIAQERNPRAIYSFFEGSKQIETIIKPDLNENAVLNHDFADLYFDKGFLYGLDRNHRKISKIDVNQKKIIRSISYEMLGDFNVRELYRIKKPYGLAEALYMDADKIYLGMDNNFIRFSQKATDKFGLKGKNSSMIIFKRPKDF